MLQVPWLAFKYSESNVCHKIPTPSALSTMLHMYPPTFISRSFPVLKIMKVHLHLLAGWMVARRSVRMRIAACRLYAYWLVSITGQSSLQLIYVLDVRRWHRHCRVVSRYSSEGKAPTDFPIYLREDLVSALHSLPPVPTGALYVIFLRLRYRLPPLASCADFGTRAAEHS